MTITLDAVVVQSEDMLFADIEDDIVMMNIETGDYYDLDHIGSEIWKMIEAPQNVGTLCKAMTEKFDVDIAKCQQDVLAFLNDMSKLGAITRQG